MTLDLLQLGWDPDALGEIDHQKVKAPYIRLASYKIGEHNDVAYFYDLRVLQPNKDYLKTDTLHSFEHFLLAGFRKYMPDNFICVAPMGCQTGFYLMLLNEGNAEKICAIYENILNDIMNAKSVPYMSIESCGQAKHHNLDGSKILAKMLLNCKTKWRQVYDKPGDPMACIA